MQEILNFIVNNFNNLIKKFISRIITDHMHIYSGKDPIIEEGDVFKVTIPLNKEENFEITPQDTPQDKKIKIREAAILKYCEKGKSIREIASYFGYSDLKSFKAKYIIPLLNIGKIRMTIPEKPTSKYQKIY